MIWRTREAEAGRIGLNWDVRRTGHPYPGRPRLIVWVIWKTRANLHGVGFELLWRGHLTACRHCQPEIGHWCDRHADMGERT